MKLTRSLSIVLITIALLMSLPATAQYTTQPYMGAVPLDATTMVLAQFPNGSKLIVGQNSEDVTLSTGGATTDTANASMLPANSLILGVNGTVTTAITGTCTGWQLGDPTTAGRFTASDTTLTVGESSVGKVQVTTGIASATTGVSQGSSAAKVRITCATGAPSAGKIRVSVAYLLLTPPSQ